MPLNRRVPKLKGFSNAGFGTTYQVVNTGRLAELFPEGGDVTPENLVARGAARKGELIKVLGTGELCGGPPGDRARVLGHRGGQDRSRPAARSPSSPDPAPSARERRKTMACRVRYGDCPINRTEDCAC